MKIYKKLIHIFIVLLILSTFITVLAQDQTQEQTKEVAIVKGIGTVSGEDDPKFANNIVNAKIALGYVNGYIVQPGKVFSFNTVVGPRTLKRHFVYGLSLSNGKYIKDLGGGVCRASTALHRAVIDAGLKVLERHKHSSSVPYAPNGDDAAVWWGKWDYKFKNTLPNPVQIQAGAGKNNVLFVKIIELNCSHPQNTNNPQKSK